ncbi:hypothetical protein FKM82_016332 [Ascaphus truei]
MSHPFLCRALPTPHHLPNRLQYLLFPPSTLPLLDVRIAGIGSGSMLFDFWETPNLMLITIFYLYGRQHFPQTGTMWDGGLLVL